MGLIALIGLVVFRNYKLHGRREKAAEELELLDLKRVTDAEYAARTCFEHSGRFLEVVRSHLSRCFDGILKQDRKQLKQLRRETSKVQSWSNIIVANTFKALRLQHQASAEADGQYTYVISALQEITESLRDIIMRCHVHTSNQHAGLLPAQKSELVQIKNLMETLLDAAARYLLHRQQVQYRDVAAHFIDLKQLVEDFDLAQVRRIGTGVSKTRLSVLYYGISNSGLKIAEQVLQLLSVFEQTFEMDQALKPDN